MSSSHSIWMANTINIDFSFPCGTFSHWPSFHFARTSTEKKKTFFYRHNGTCTIEMWLQTTINAPGKKKENPFRERNTWSDLMELQVRISIDAFRRHTCTHASMILVTMATIWNWFDRNQILHRKYCIKWHQMTIVYFSINIHSPLNSHGNKPKCVVWSRLACVRFRSIFLFFFLFETCASPFIMFIYLLYL